MRHLNGAWFRSGAAGLVIGACWLALVATGMLARSSWWGYHWLYEWRGPVAPGAPVALVLIDEATLEDLGRWPLPRRTYASLVDGLMRAGAHVVAFDIAFAESTPDDARFIEALTRHPNHVVLAANIQPLGHASLSSHSMVEPTPGLHAVAASGIVNFQLDADGAIHRMARRFACVRPDRPTEMVWKPSFDEVVARLAQKQGFPLAKREDWAPWLIHYRGPGGTFPSASLSAVLDAIRQGHDARLALFRGQVVLVGAASTRLQDLYPTPYTATVTGEGAASYMPGVEIHANAIATRLANDPIRELPLRSQAAVLLILGMLLGQLFACLRPRSALLIGLTLAALVVTLSAVAFSSFGWWFDFIAPVGLLLTVYVWNLVIHLLRSEAARRELRQTFERYVSSQIVEHILKSPDMLPNLGGERREVTVLFSDIRSFTTISEAHSPEEVVRFLNVYLTEMADVILESGGCIDKYIGDAILAVWGNVERLSPEEGAIRAARAALGMQARLAQCRAAWQAQGFPRIDIGIGLNTGDAVVGNLGSPKKMEFGVIGDAINVASRLEGLTKEYPGYVLLSGRTRELLGTAFEPEDLGEVRVKGRQATVRLFGLPFEAATNQCEQTGS